LPARLTVFDEGTKNKRLVDCSALTGSANKATKKNTSFLVILVTVTFSILPVFKNQL
jgi:hypothetical protein